MFSDLTVRENLELGSYATKDYNWDQVTDRFSQAEAPHGPEGRIPERGGTSDADDRQSHTGQPESFALIDEPTEGLAPRIVAQLKNVFKELSKKSALVIVEQNLPLVCAISDKIYAIKEGRIVTELTDPESIKPHVCEQYL